MDVPAPSRARSPPRPVKKERKPTPPSPPQLIRDIGHNVDYQRLGFLGEVSGEKELGSSQSTWAAVFVV